MLSELRFPNKFAIDRSSMVQASPINDEFVPTSFRAWSVTLITHASVHVNPTKERSKQHRVPLPGCSDDVFGS
jgi:hypothetical protein